MKVHCRPLGGEIFVCDVHEVPDVEGISIDQVPRELIDVSFNLGVPVRL
jgi:hypothetical protein